MAVRHIDGPVPRHHDGVGLGEGVAAGHGDAGLAEGAQDMAPPIELEHLRTLARTGLVVGDPDVVPGVHIEAVREDKEATPERFQEIPARVELQDRIEGTVGATVDAAAIGDPDVAAAVDRHAAGGAHGPPRRQLQEAGVGRVGIGPGIGIGLGRVSARRFCAGRGRRQGDLAKGVDTDVGEALGAAGQLGRTGGKAVEFQHIGQNVGIGFAGQAFGRVHRHGVAHAIEQVAHREAVPTGEEGRPGERFGLADPAELSAVAALAVARIGVRAPGGLGLGIDPAPDRASAGLTEDQRRYGHDTSQGERKAANEPGARAAHCAVGRVKAIYSPL
jgi:hypothetical protein